MSAVSSRVRQTLIGRQTKTNLGRLFYPKHYRQSKLMGLFLRNDLFGNVFNSACKGGWNRRMKALMDAPKENGDTGPGYEWRSHRPTTQNFGVVEK